MKAVCIAGTHSGCGKTTIALGLMAALRKKGFVVQPFKAGPDFIDTGLHRLASGRRSRNLDIWMCGVEYVKASFERYAASADISVIEGVMGLYDGEYSTNRLAQILGLPVVLVVDGYGMAESAGAVVKGFAEFWHDGHSSAPLAGVIFNRVASQNHFERLKHGVRNLAVLGYLPRDPGFEIPHRHLGLVTFEESPLSDKAIDNLADTVLTYIDIERLLKLSDIRGIDLHKLGRAASGDRRPEVSRPPIRIAIAHDRAFNFYYEDNIDMLKDAGAEIVGFSPLSDPRIPDDIDAVYIGGGYPELYAEALSRNTSMLDSVRLWAEEGRAIYAECGGLMYLSRGLHDSSGRFFKMAGVFDFETRMTRRPRLGYREVMLNQDCILGRKGDRFRGHEFHYSEVISGTAGPKQYSSVYIVSDNKGNSLMETDGYLYKNTLAGYIHLHFGYNPMKPLQFHLH